MAHNNFSHNDHGLLSIMMSTNNQSSPDNYELEFIKSMEQEHQLHVAQVDMVQKHLIIEITFKTSIAAIKTKRSRSYSTLAT